VTAPTLVIHGTEDPSFPSGHAIALAREIAGAERLLLDGVGHQAHRARRGPWSCPPSCGTPRRNPPRQRHKYEAARRSRVRIRSSMCSPHRIGEHIDQRNQFEVRPLFGTDGNPAPGPPERGLRVAFNDSTPFVAYRETWTLGSVSFTAALSPRLVIVWRLGVSHLPSGSFYSS